MTLTITTVPSSSSPWISVTTGKCITAVIMFLSVLVAILLPVLIVSRLSLERQQSSARDRFTLWVGRLSCFAAGVFLSTGFMEIFPEAIESIKEAGVKLNVKITFPLASFFTLLGFFLILSIEQFIFIYNENVKKIVKKDENNDESSDRIVRNESSQILITKEPDVIVPVASISRMNELTKPQSRNADSSFQDDEHFVHGAEDDNHNNEHKEEHDNILHHNKSRIIALMSAISVHAIFEGFAIGLSTTISGVTELFLALSLHKLIIAASLGLNLATTKLRLWFKIIVGLIFAMGSPLGIVVGMGVMKLESGGNNVFSMVGGALEGVACGTFLYVVFFEILPHEMGHHSKMDRAGKLTGLLLGFILVCLYLLFVEKN